MAAFVAGGGVGAVSSGFLPGSPSLPRFLSKTATESSHQTFSCWRKPGLNAGDACDEPWGVAAGDVVVVGAVDWDCEAGTAKAGRRRELGLYRRPTRCGRSSPRSCMQAASIPAAPSRTARHVWACKTSPASRTSSSRPSPSRHRTGTAVRQNTRTTTIKPTTTPAAARAAHIPSRSSIMVRARAP